MVRECLESSAVKKVVVIEPDGWLIERERSCLDVDRGRGKLNHLVTIECGDGRGEGCRARERWAGCR
jgi:hypothetical protein